VSPEVEEFHFIDLLSLHFRAQLDLPETRGLLPLMQRLSGLSLLGNLMLFPGPLIEILREELHDQHPWLLPLRTPPFVHPERNWADWALFWAWVDKTQIRTCDSLGVAPDGFPVRRAERISATFIVITDPDDEG
jgi:hypothetical protein